MQTFLPFKDFDLCAKVLDRKTLEKQRLVVYKLILMLEDPSAKKTKLTEMWRGYIPCLAQYGAAMCHEWLRRGYKDMYWSYFYSLYSNKEVFSPPWLGNITLHASHKSNLLRRNYAHYRQFEWKETTTMPYYWPVEVSSVQT